MPQPSTRSGTIQQLKRLRLELCLSRASDTYTSNTSVLCEHTSLMSFNTPLFGGRACPQGEWNLIESNPQGFYFNNWGVDCTLFSMAAAMEQRSPASHSLQALDPPTPTTAPIKVMVASHPEIRCGWCPYQNQPWHQRHWKHAAYIGMLPHKNSLQDHNR